VSSQGARRTFLIAIALSLLTLIFSPDAGKAQNSNPDWSIERPGIKEVQVPFASLKPEATFKIGENADWVEIADDAVWVASSNPASVHRIDPRTNKEVAIICPATPVQGRYPVSGASGYRCVANRTR
jgi:hypothetical protein